MNQTSFDAITRTLTRTPRRDVLRGLIGASLGLGLGALRLPSSIDAKKNSHKKHAKKRKQKKQDQNQNPPGDTPSPPPAGCTPACGNRTCGDDGCGGSCGTCGADHRCQDGTCLCTPESPASTCAGRCGTWTSNCGQPITCPTCPPGHHCLSNGSCAIACTDDTFCPAVCGDFPSCGNPNTEGAKHCITDYVSPLTACTTTADCPLGSHCQPQIGAAVCVRICTLEV
jgi:hypothetical protein